MAYEPTTPRGKACQLLAQHANRRSGIQALSYAMVERTVADALGLAMDLEPCLREQAVMDARDWMRTDRFEAFCYECDLEPSWVRAVVKRLEQ